LYINSAQLVAHVIVGLANLYDLDLASSSTAIVGHGGCFKVEGYANRIQQIIAHNNMSRRCSRVYTTYDDCNSPNACLDGAAIFAALGDYPDLQISEGLT